MLLATEHARLDLQNNQFFRLSRTCGTRVDYVAGSAWITIDGERRDVVLSAGESFLVDSHAPLVVQAILGAATVALRAQASVCPPPPRRARRSWHGWLASAAPVAAAV